MGAVEGTHLLSRGRRCSRGIFGNLSGAWAIHRGCMAHGYHSGEHYLGWLTWSSRKQIIYQLVTGDRFLCQQNLDTLSWWISWNQVETQIPQRISGCWGDVWTQPTKPNQTNGFHEISRCVWIIATKTSQCLGCDRNLRTPDRWSWTGGMISFCWWFQMVFVFFVILKFGEMIILFQNGLKPPPEFGTFARF